MFFIYVPAAFISPILATIFFLIADLVKCYNFIVGFKKSIVGFALFWYYF